MSMIFAALGPVLKSMFFSLLTETFVKRFVYNALVWAAARSTNKVDDKMAEDVGKAWGLVEE